MNEEKKHIKYKQPDSRSNHWTRFNQEKALDSRMWVNILAFTFQSSGHISTPVNDRETKIDRC